MTIGADSKAVKRVLDGVSKVAPGLSFMGFSSETPGDDQGKLLVFNVVAGAAAEVSPVLFVVVAVAVGDGTNGGSRQVQMMVEKSRGGLLSRGGEN